MNQRIYHCAVAVPLLMVIDLLEVHVEEAMVRVILVFL